MKLISWNVNGLRACEKKGFADFFRQEEADLFAVQETKLQAEQFPASLAFDGWHRYMNCAERRGYSGTLVYSREEPLQVLYDLPHDTSREGRTITLEFPAFWFVCAYVPNSKEGLVRLDERLAWEKDLRAWLKKLDRTKPVIYTGDLNVAHEEIDIRNPESNHENAGFSDGERHAFDLLLKSGFADTFRQLHPSAVAYSWWSYRFHAREKNIGWRLDYFIVSRRLLDQVEDSEILSTVEGSDHCPIRLRMKKSFPEEEI